MEKDFLKYIDMCSNRKNDVLKLYDFLLTRGLLIAPASTSSHNSFRGGLAEHSVNVTRTLLDLKKLLLPFASDESCVIIGLFHDAHKVCDVWGNKYYIDNILKSGEISEAKPWVINKKYGKFVGGEMSAMVVNKYVELTPYEYQAIRYHDGQYVRENSCVVNNEFPLTLLLHWADMWEATQKEKITSGYYEMMNQIRKGAT